MKKIVLELSTQSVEDALNELNQYKNTVDRKLNLVCKRLAEVGAEEARIRATGAKEGFYGNDDVHVFVEPYDKGWKVVMSGADIYFVEFGTGIYAGEYPGDASNVSVGIMPGDYSEGHAKQYSEKGYWFYDNQFYRGTPAEMPMYYAGKRMREEMPRIIKEVFGK